MSRRVCVALFAAVGLRAAPPPEFVGVLTSNGMPQVRLVDRGAGDSRWLSVGAEFRGFTVVSYEPQQDAVVLAKAGAEFRVFLPHATVKPATTSLAPELVAAIRANLQQIVTAARRHFLEGKARFATLDDLVGPGRHLEQLTPVAGEDYSSLTFMKGEIAELTVTTRGGETVSLAP